MSAPWWQQTYAFARQAVTLTKKSEQHDSDIKELQRQVKELTTGIQLLALQRQQDQEMAAKDRELLVLRLENRLLRHERSLPTPADRLLDEDAP